MDPQLTRASLLSRVRDPADHDAWRQFEACYGELIVRYAKARGLGWADAEDVRQHVLMDLCRSLRSFQYDPCRGRFRDYLGRAVRNVVFSLRARPDGRAAAEGMDEDAHSAAQEREEPDSVWEQEWLDHHYRRALATARESFDPRSVEIFERLVAGETVAGVAASYGVSTEAVHKIKQRLRDRLKELIAAQIREEDEPDGPRFPPIPGRQP